MSIIMTLALAVGIMAPIEAKAATKSKKCTMTFSESLDGIKFSSSNGSLADVTKVSSKKYIVDDVTTGTTVVKATLGGQTLKSTLKITVDKNGYPTLTFTANDNMKFTTSKSSIISVTKTDGGVNSVTYKIKFKSTGTATLKLSVNGVTYMSCKCNIE